MKQALALIFLSVSFVNFAQNKYFGDIQVGAATTVIGSGVYQGTAGFNFATAKGLHLRLGADFALGGSNKKKNSVLMYTQYSLRVGYLNSISEKFGISPYIGIGYQTGNATGIRYDAEANAAAEQANAVAGLLGKTVDTTPRYLEEKFSSIAMPFGVDFHFHKEKVGFVTGFYTNLSKHSEVGVRLGITFGKL